MKAAVFLFFLFPLIAEANFSGRWAGEFQMVNKKGETFLCEELSFGVLQDQKQAIFGEWVYACGGYAFKYVPPTLQIEGEKVYLKNKYNDYIGTVTGDKVDIQLVVNDMNGRTHIQVTKISDTEIKYHEEQLDVDPETGKDLKTIFDATLKKN
jgi:hypothetical protein